MRQARDPGAYVLLFFLCFFVLLSSGRIASSDAGHQLQASVMLAVTGHLGDDGRSGGPANDAWVRAPNGRLYQAHDIGNVALMFPAAWIGSRLSPASPSEDMQNPPALSRVVVSLTGAVVATLGCYWLYRLFALYYDTRAAFLLSLAFPTTTIFIAYARAAWDVLPAAALVCGVLYYSAALLRGVSPERSAVMIALTLGAACSFRFSLAPFIAPAVFGVVAARRRVLMPRAIVISAVVLAVVMLPSLAYNTIRTGSPLRPATATVQYLQSNNALTGSIPHGLVGLFVSPNRGLFTYSPVLLFAFALPFLWKRLPADQRILLIWYGGGAFAYTLLIAKMVNWGAFGWGPRYLLPVLPVVFFAAATAIQYLFHPLKPLVIVTDCHLRCPLAAAGDRQLAPGDDDVSWRCRSQRGSSISTAGRLASARLGNRRQAAPRFGGCSRGSIARDDRRLPRPAAGASIGLLAYRISDHRAGVGGRRRHSLAMRFSDPRPNCSGADGSSAAGRPVSMTDVAALEKYPCSACGAQAEWNPARQLLVCPFCGASAPFKIAADGTIVEHDLAKALRETPETERGWLTEKRTVKCQSCQAISVFDPARVGQNCDFCGSPALVDYQEIKAPIRPQSLLPFKITEGHVREQIRGWYASKWLAPNRLKRKALVDRVHGVYIPYWTFDAHVVCPWQAEAGHYYYTTERQGNQTKRVRHVRWEPASGEVRHFFDDEPVPGTRGVSPALLRRVQPFPTRELVPYDTAFLSGFVVEHYQLVLQEASERSEDAMTRQVHEMCAAEVPGDTHRNLRIQPSYSARTFKHILVAGLAAQLHVREPGLASRSQWIYRADCRRLS